jgi:hypothetical protein
MRPWNCGFGLLGMFDAYAPLANFGRNFYFIIEIQSKGRSSVILPIRTVYKAYVATS